MNGLEITALGALLALGGIALGVVLAAAWSRTRRRPASPRAES
ncbi:MAG TPA: hypothetical protein VEA81_02730 [Burkholderiaceae bacterium]|nr:hypothetical protein [Burkholderiaceae bacterium]